MQKYQSTITATNGSVIRNVPVTVIKEDGSLAEIFMDREGQVQAPNPLVTDSRGVFYFYAKNGRYSLRTAADGVQITDADTVLLFDPDETASDGPIADAVRRAEDAAERAETALGDSGLQNMVQDAQDAAANAAQAVIDAHQAVASIDAALIEVSEAKEDAQAAAQTASNAASDAQAVKDSLLNYDGTLSATPEWSAVPAHEDSNLDAQTQAALNRIEKLKDDQQLKVGEVIEAEPSWSDVPKHKSDVFNAQAQALANRVEYTRSHAISSFEARYQAGDTNAQKVAAAYSEAGPDRAISISGGERMDAGWGSFYGPQFKNASGLQLLQGNVANPVSSKDPVLWVAKASNSDYEGGFDQTAYFALEKRSGTAYAAALSSNALSAGGSGDVVSFHARARSGHNGAQIFGAWIYADGQNFNNGRVVGAEVSIRNTWGDPGWAAAGGAGQWTCLNLGTADGTYSITQGINFPDRVAGNMQRCWTGLKFGQNSIMPTNSDGNGEAIRIRGGTSPSNRYGGIAIGDSVGVHTMSWGLRMKDAEFDLNAAIWLRPGHKVLWGSDKSASTWIRLGDTSNNLEINGMNVQIVSGAGQILIGANKVVGARKTGWQKATGTTTRTSFNTTSVTLEGLAERVAALINDLYDQHGLIGA